MTSEPVDSKHSPEGRTLFEIYDPWELEFALEQAEGEILRELRAGAGFIRTGIEVLDYLVDQVRFLKAALGQAERKGLRGLPALEWAAYLSWPETRRLAKTQWRRDLVKCYAFERPAWVWQRALHARHPDDPVNVGPSREDIWYPPELQLGPYPSELQLTGMTPALLEAHVQFDPRTTPGPLTPVRRLNQAMTWTLQVSAARLYSGAFRPFDIIIDEPRTYSPDDARATLLARAAHLESLLQGGEKNLSPVPPAVRAQWRQGLESLQAAADQVGRGNTRNRATLLELCFSISGTWWFGPVEILTDDLPPEWLGVMLGFAFDRRGLLSVRDGKQLRKVAKAVSDHSHATRHPYHELSEETSRRVVDRLRHVRRLLQPSSLVAYVEQVTGVRRR